VRYREDTFNIEKESLMKNASYALIALITFSSSMAALQKSDWATGMQMTRAALRDRGLDQTERLAAVTNLCVEAANAGYLNEAITACNESIRLSPDRAGLYVNRANVRLLMDDRAGAHADYARAKSIDPANGLAEQSKASIESGLGGNYVVLVTGGMAASGTQLATSQAE
jgi:tetratricopeptide (TPR) repeat protein